MTQLEQLQALVSAFCDQRDWAQYHSLKELTIGLSTESNELLQLLRFKSDEEILALLKTKPELIQDELADVFYFLLRIADLYQIDLDGALRSKMIQNEAKYPIEKSKGKNLKFNELDPGE